MTNEQLYLAIGLPIIVNILFNGALIGIVYNALDRRISQAETSLKELWRAELHRVEEVLDARLKHLEER
ncbi:MAG TPA: hypothetical protein VN841_28050 [Bryobacteraceae bacterium]|nr:hypothetical protein [Bryobacteraceae bacterium]